MVLQCVYRTRGQSRASLCRRDLHVGVLVFDDSDFGYATRVRESISVSLDPGEDGTGFSGVNFTV